MSADDPTLHGYRRVAAIIERMRPLADWLSRNRKECCVLTLRRRDYDELRRNADAALLHSIVVEPDGTVRWGSFTLRPDNSAPARKPRSTPADL